MTKAESAAWAVYVARVQLLVNGQGESFARGDTPVSITLAPPTHEHVGIIQRVIDAAVKDAKEEIITAALGPLVRALDAIDNSHSKSQTVKDSRVGLQHAYDELHALKRSASATKVDAVDPHADSTGKLSTRV